MHTKQIELCVRAEGDRGTNNDFQFAQRMFASCQRHQAVFCIYHASYERLPREKRRKFLTAIIIPSILLNKQNKILSFVGKRCKENETSASSFSKEEKKKHIFCNLLSCQINKRQKIMSEKKIGKFSN